MTKRIVVKLSKGGVDAALQEVNSLIDGREKRVHAKAKEIADEICSRAQVYFDAAWYDEVGRGVRNHAEVKCSVEETQNGWRVIAKGREVTFIEFGAGVYHNPPVGASPHPRGAEVGFLIGGYGAGHGKQTVWGYYADEGKQELILTRGTAMQQPLYRAFSEVLAERRTRK